MTRLRLLLPFALLALAATTPSSLAHAEAFSESKAVTTGPFAVSLDPRPAPLYAGAAIKMYALITDLQNGTSSTSTNLTVDLADPQGRRIHLDLSTINEDYDYRSAPLDASRPGNYTATVTVRDGRGGQWSAGTWFTVYPNLPVRVLPSQEKADPYTGIRYSIDVQTLNASTNRPSDALTDLSLRLEHWTDDHQTLLGRQEFALQPNGTGRWNVDHVFPQPGMYHLMFGSHSGNFGYADNPVYHMYVVNPPTPAPSTVAGGGSPAPGPLFALAALIGAVGWCRRRGR